MAVARVFEGKGWTPDQYDALIEELGLDGKAAPGVLFHWAERTDEGMRAIDVYESREVADRLVSERVGPAAQRLGLPLPEISEHEVHAYLD
ncbi:MAG TPA: hypothetical protein VGI77_09465 [Gaiellaceae bacterium]|jgi:hypothetical protein